jgi:dodecin
MLGLHETAEQAAGLLPCTASCAGSRQEEGVLSTYRVIEVIGTSATSWEDAAAQAVKTAGETLHDLRVAEVVKRDIHLDESGGITFRTKLELSFKYEHEHRSRSRSQEPHSRWWPKEINQGEWRACPLPGRPAAPLFPPMIMPSRLRGHARSSSCPRY